MCCFKVLRHLLLLALLLWEATASAGAPPRTLRFEQLSVEHGLAQETVLAIAQDKQGFIWLGTQAGLTRFDGYRTIVYKSAVSDPRSLVDNWVRVLHLDPSGQLWVGTDGGLDRYDSVTKTFTHFLPRESAQRGNGNRHVRAITDDGLGGLWVATADGLHHFDPASKRFTSWHHDPADAGSLVSDHVNALARDASGRLWVGTAAGLDMLPPGGARFQHYAVDASGDSKFNSVVALQVDGAQTLWVGTQGGLEQWGLLGDEPQRRRLGAQQGLQPGVSITSLYEDAEANLWAGSLADGLFRWLSSEGRMVPYRHQVSDTHSVADNQISALFRDRVGTFWVGTWNDGVSRVDMGSGGFARIVRQADQPNALSDNKVRAIVADGRGKLWLGSSGGLNLYDPVSGASKVWRHDPRLANSINDDQVTSLWREKNGNLWIGGPAGVNHLNLASGAIRSLSFVRGDPASDTIRNIVQDRSGILWVASRGGLHRVDPQTLETRTFRHDPADIGSLSDNVVRPILEDRKGQLWIGTFNGLDLLDRKTGKFRHFRRDAADPYSLSHDEVHYLYEDARGTIWVGTAAGLNKMEVAADGNVRFRRYLRKDGIADDAIASILPDDAGNLWVSTNSGLSRLNIDTGLVRNYSGADGTIEGAYFDGSALRTPDGTLYFGGFNGITAFLPGDVRENSVAPMVAITDFQIFNKSLKPGQGDHPDVLKTSIEHTGALTLLEADSVFSLEFAALHYAAPQRNRFAYQLQGFDEDWVVTDSTKRFATYTNLDAGKYVFRVKAANKDGIWNDNAATLEITILPPFWKTWWFRTLLGLLALGGVYAAYHARVRSLRHQQLRLEQLVGSRTAEVEYKNQQLQQQKHELERRRLEAEAQRAEAEQRRLDTERQKEEVEQAHRNISVLSELGREMSASLNVETTMQTLYRHVNHLMNAQIFGIGFVHQKDGVIDFPFAIESGVRSLPYQRRLDQPNQLAVWCLTHRKPILINDFQKEYRDYMDDSGLDSLIPCAREDGVMPAPAQSMMYAPLIAGDKVVGLLSVHSRDKNSYQRIHMDMLQTLASHAAAGLENARAYQELEETLQTLRQTRDQLRYAKKKAEDATRQKSEFLANMSHEMRTPLAGVIGMLGFALRDLQVAAGTREQILRAQANAQSLLSIINDLLDFSKIEAGKLSIENIDFALSSAVENVVSLFEEQAAAHSVGFALEFGDGLPQFVVGDPTRLRQVLVNLVGNAFKFTQQGTVTMRVERVPDEDAENRIRFSVSDTGIGIEADAIPRLFQQFEQADASTTRRYGGTGLGLAICRQLVELMGGEISAVSTPGKGSTFLFELPLPNGVPPPVVPHVPREPHSHQLKVLCAEDFPTNQIIIRMMLEDLGHKVDIAANGALAVKACSLTRYDLILMDGRMPEMDGASATRLIRSGGPEEAPVRDQELMIIALTANASEEDRSRYLASGMDDFLTKPIDEDKLHFQLSRAIERQLQRGFQLPRMQPRRNPASGTPELDSMFGVAPAALETSRLAQHSGASDLKARLRSAFNQDAPLRLLELEQALATRDREAASRLLHGMKGSAGYLEEQELQALCGDLELEADHGNWTQVETAMAQLRRLLAATGTQ
ncbi:MULTISPECIES: two-component regulator propeller domain-containing protein [unclassified Duganella]|uniref:two-component regulator propeller domain-containing protein n=1 Tax=unclassified Duganella TaxID=2636909 RepID=UPI00087E5A9F|nr:MULTISPECIES: two-component regulator propeller domain-containing protein [unclassified Duganella]SDH35180.1 Signal transduction histidine kinase [Duganella sp. OV458]SDK51707.1 Signal transduction histidine kinase [Duganella sp. OV510]